MDKSFFHECIQKEVYAPYQESKGRLTLFDKVWCKYFSPESNAVYLIRKKLYYESRGGRYAFRARFLHVKLMRRYEIHVDAGTEIGKGLRIAHPTSIVITRCNIGDHFTIFQNCTIGQKSGEKKVMPTIGNHVCMQGVQ